MRIKFLTLNLFVLLLLLSCEDERGKHSNKFDNSIDEIIKFISETWNLSEKSARNAFYARSICSDSLYYYTSETKLPNGIFKIGVLSSHFSPLVCAVKDSNMYILKRSDAKYILLFLADFVDESEYDEMVKCYISVMEIVETQFTYEEVPIIDSLIEE